MSTFGVQAFGLSGWGIAEAGLASSTDSAICPVTTWSAIRANMATVIDALTPRYLAGETFRLTDHETETFRDWAESNDTASLRRYEIEALEFERLSAENFQVQLRRANAEIVVAYPMKLGFYRTRFGAKRTDHATAHDLIEYDADQILKAVGVRGSANYVDGQLAAVEEIYDVEAGDGVWFLTIGLDVQFYFDAN